MKKWKVLGITLLCGITLAGCGEKKTENNGSATTKTEETSQSSQSDSTTNSSVENTELEEGVEARSKYEVDWEESWHEVSFKITDISAVEYSDEEAISFLDTEFAVGVKFVIENNSDHTITTYPDQGKIVINGKQYDANMFVSDDVGGELLNGTSVEGVVAYPVKGISSVDEITELRVAWDANDFDDMENYEDTTKNFDVTFELSK